MGDGAVMAAWAFLVTTVVAVPILAGCLGPTGSQGLPASEANSAMLQQAVAWQSDAVLVAMRGREIGPTSTGWGDGGGGGGGGNLSPARALDLEYRGLGGIALQQVDWAGEGRPPVWRGIYFSDAAKGFLAVEYDGKTTVAGQWELPPFANATVLAGNAAPWLDASQAIQVVRDASDDVDSFLDEGSFGLTYTLSLLNKTWTLEGGGRAMQFFAVVSADQGEVQILRRCHSYADFSCYPVTCLCLPELPLPQVSLNGTDGVQDIACLTDYDGCPSAAFRLLRETYVTVDLAWGSAANSYAFEIHGRDAMVREGGDADNPVNSRHAYVRLPPGDYTIYVIPERGVFDEWQLTTVFE